MVRRSKSQLRHLRPDIVSLCQAHVGTPDRGDDIGDVETHSVIQGGASPCRQTVPYFEDLYLAPTATASAKRSSY